jgi:SAM-dependent methyltransferase
MPSRRQKQIDAILKDLRGFKPRRAEEYALAENIRFFEAAKNPFSFVRWQLVHAPKIEADKLLELADYPFPKWQDVMYEQLNSVERKEFPGLLKPLRNYLSKVNATVFMDIGCGNMEVERQLLKVFGDDVKVFVGIDLSSEAVGMIQKNFSEQIGTVEIRQATSLDKKTLDLCRGWKGPKHLIVFVQKDALKIDPAELKGRVDVIFSSKFRHHLPADNRLKLDELMVSVGCPALEFDDYRTAPSWIPLALTAWRKPALLNGALLSRLRQPSKKELKQAKASNVQFFSPPGSYIKILRS